MRILAVFSLVPAVASCVWAMIAAYRMGAWLSHHGVKVNWFWYRVLMPWYVHRYKTMTVESQGRPGPLFVQFIVTINLALVFGVAGIIATVAGKR